MESKYYKPLKMLYDHHVIFEDGLAKAVEDKRITAEEYELITGEMYGE